MHEAITNINFIKPNRGDRTPDALATLPTDVLTKLEQAVIEIDMHLIEDVNAEILTHNASLAEALSRSIDDYEYDEILCLIQKVKEGYL